MLQPAPANLTIEAAYRDRTPGSARLAAQAAELFPSGVTHDGRHLEPYGAGSAGFDQHSHGRLDDVHAVS
jgi:hypothetical protein